MDKVKLEPTAAFVIDLAADLFAADDLTRRYVERLDLSSARELIEDAKREGVYELSRELMCSRKFTVRRELLEAAADASSPVQVAILAAGKSPVSLEILGSRGAGVKKIFEVDVSPFDDKRRLYELLAPESRGRVAFLEEDVCSPRLIDRLRGLGFDPTAKTVVVLEGITHYLPPEKLRTCLASFASGRRRNRAVIEFGPPFETLADWVRPKARAVYRSIEKICFRSGMVKYAADELRGLLSSLGGSLDRHYRMNEMERLRTGANRFFKEDNSGWVEVVVGTL
ncbi:MAG: class I SAM-dependent methyltransferase [Elusimicrobia bacterium]|nr:class I SAM-dependent methyltransferase [Elusimicrobiota bacterium]